MAARWACCAALPAALEGLRAPRVLVTAGEQKSYLLQGLLSTPYLDIALLTILVSTAIVNSARPVTATTTGLHLQSFNFADAARHAWLAAAEVPVAIA